MTDPIADRTAPGTWRIYDTDTARVGIDAGDDGPVVIFASRFSNKDFGGVYHEADARFIVYADRTIEAYEAVVEAARNYSPERDHDWRCEYRTAEVGWQPGDSPVIRCECGYDELQTALAALDIAKEAGR